MSLASVEKAGDDSREARERLRLECIAAAQAGVPAAAIARAAGLARNTVRAWISEQS